MLFYYTILVRNALFSKSAKIKQDIYTYTHETRTVLCHAHTITSAKMTFPTTCKTQLPQKMVGQTSTITQFLVKLDLRP